MNIFHFLINIYNAQIAAIPSHIHKLRCGSSPRKMTTLTGTNRSADSIISCDGQYGGDDDRRDDSRQYNLKLCIVGPSQFVKQNVIK